MAAMCCQVKDAVQYFTLDKVKFFKCFFKPPSLEISPERSCFDTAD